MNIKRIVAGSLFLSIIHSGFSQTRFKVSAGLSLSFPAIKEKSGKYPLSGQVSPAVGISGIFKVKGKISFEPSLSFIQLCNKLTDTIFINSSLINYAGNYKNKLNYILLEPASFYYNDRFNNKLSFSLGLGPYLGFLLSESKQSDFVDNYQGTVNTAVYFHGVETYRKIDFGAVINGSIRVTTKIGVMILYTVEINNIAQKSSFSYYNEFHKLDYKNRYYRILLYYLLK